MGHIKQINVGDTSYVIEPALYATATLSDNNYTASFKDSSLSGKFQLITGVTISVEFSVTNPAAAELKIDTTDSKEMRYENAALPANLLKVGHSYIFSYDGQYWQLLGDINTHSTVSHIHGNITYGGAIGSTANQAVYTSTNGVLVAGSLATTDPTTSGNALSFIDSVSQNSYGKISATKKTVQSVSASQAGVAPKGESVTTQNQSTKFLRSDGTWAVPSYTTNVDTQVTQTKVEDSSSTGSDLNILLKNSDNLLTETSTTKFVGTSGAQATINTKTGNIKAPTFTGTSTNQGAIHFIGKASSASTADRASHVAWSAIDSNTIPTTLSGYGITDAATSTHGHGILNNNGTMTTASRAVVTDSNKNIALEDLTSSNSATSGTSLAFIDAVSQGSTGKISATKKSIPTVSASTAGLVPQGAAVSSQSTSTKFLREDGSWAAPSYISNTDTKVTQTGNTDNKDFPILLKNTDGTAQETAGVKFGSGDGKLITYNPNTGTIKIGTGTLTAANYSGKAATAGTADSANAVAWSAVSSKPTTLSGYGITDAATSTHGHGNINNNGTLTATGVAIAQNDTLLIADASSSPAGKISQTSIKFDGTTTTKALTQAGTWETFNYYTYTLPAAGSSLGGVKTGFTVDATNRNYPLALNSSNQAYTNVPWTDEKVTQSASTESADIPVLLKGTATTGSVRYPNTTNKLVTVNPSTGNITAPTFTGLASKATADGSGNTITTTYAPITSPVLKGTPKLETSPTSASDGKAIASKEYVDSITAVNDAMIYKGVINGGNTAGSTTYTSAADRGWTYKVGTAGYINGLPFETGDTLICLEDNTAAANSSNVSTIRGKWSAVQVNLDGAVIGPASSTDGHIVTFNGTTGKLVSDSGKSFSTDAPASTSNDTTIPTSKAVWGAIAALDGNLNSTTPAASKTLTAFSQTDGKISATFGNISISPSQAGLGNVTNTKQLPISGGTMTGVLTLLGSQYNDGYDGALNANNSDIYNLNSIYTCDAAESASEGIHFYRDSTHVDTLWMSGGSLLFVPNRVLGTGTSAANSEKVLRGPATIVDGYVFAANSTGGLTKQIQATNANTASTIVQRDASGNFSAGTITANITGSVSGSSGSCSGNAATATKFNSSRTIKLTGAVTGEASSTGESGWTISTSVNHTHSYAGSDSVGGPANTVRGAYTANGGQQNPNYFGKNNVGFLMMNTTVNSNSQYKDWIIMDCYNGSDVGGGVAFGVNRQSLGAYIMRSAAARDAWAESAELIGTHNYTTYTVKKDGTGASGSWGISITGNAGGSSSSCTGNAATATKWASAQTVYVNLANPSTTTTLQGGGNAVALGINGILGVANGGTGVNASTISAGYVFAGPTTGSATTPSFRALVASDIPNLAASKITSGQIAVAQGGTGVATTSANKVFAGPSSGTDAAPSFRTLVAADIPNLAASKINSGQLAIAQGGTGAATAANALAALGGMPNTTVVTNVNISADVTTDNNYPVVFAAATTSTTTAQNSGLQKNTGKLYFNPYNGTLTATKVANAIWNDYAEYRESETPIPGTCVQENDNGCLTESDQRLIPGASIISDTFGFSQGKTEKAQTPIAVSGRVLAYTYRPREEYHAGMAVCSAPNGTIDIMTREEIREYPDAIIGIVSEIPDYEYWGTGNAKVNGRIWIKVK